VRRQVAGRRERLAARLADMRLLPSMRAHVRRQLAGGRERLATCLAVEASRRATTSHFPALVRCSTLRVRVAPRVRVNATSCIVRHATRAVRVCRVFHTNRLRVTGNRVVGASRALQRKIPSRHGRQPFYSCCLMVKK
jgi:hypothetical protein